MLDVPNNTRNHESQEVALPALTSEQKAERNARLRSVVGAIDDLTRTLRIQIPDPGFPKIDDLKFDDNLQAAQIRAELTITGHHRYEDFRTGLARDPDMKALIGAYKVANRPEHRRVIGEKILVLTNKKIEEARLRGAPFEAATTDPLTVDDVRRIMRIHF
ncbi:MAG: hypothetical protein Q7S01_02890 [bacterium]|nr:hypothetical protein [bacterium]